MSVKEVGIGDPRLLLPPDAGDFEAALSATNGTEVAQGLTSETELDSGDEGPDDDRIEGRVMYDIGGFSIGGEVKDHPLFHGVDAEFEIDASASLGAVDVFVTGDNLTDEPNVDASVSVDAGRVTVGAGVNNLGTDNVNYDLSVTGRIGQTGRVGVELEGLESNDESIRLLGGFEF